MDILQNIFRAIMFFLDNVVYGLIPEIYKVFIFLSELNLYSTDETNPLYQLVSHVYVLLGIFMLFKVSFSLLQYLVDPNAFRDSSKGIGKLVTNVLVALVLLVSVPYIFSAAMELQSTIVQENVIGQLILGRNASDDSDGLSLEKVDAMAKDLQFMLYGTFYRVNTDVIGECAGTSGVFGSKDTATYNDGGCLEALNQFVSSDDNASANGVTLYSFYKYAPAEGTDQGNCVGNVCDDRKFSDFGTLLYGKEDGQYVINYMPFISAAAGIYVVFLLISFTIDIAVRAIKLCFLQMVAPIAIVSYIDPKESIGSGKLNNWIKECASTYFSLFLRLATIFFVMLLIEMISSSILADGNYISGQIHEAGDYSIWIYLFLVIGAFMFAKQVPKMIESIFGIKGSGELSLNPFKNAGMVALAGVGATAGAAVGSAAANTWALGRNIWKNRGHNISDFKENLGNAKGLGKLGVIKGAVSPLLGIAGGAVSGTVRAGKAAASGQKPMQAFTSAVHGTNEARYRRDVNQEANYGIGARVLDTLDAAAGVKNKDAGVGKMDKDIKIIQREMDNVRMSEQSARELQTNMASKDWDSYQKLIQKNTDGTYKFADYNKDGQFVGFNYDSYEKWYLDEMDKQSKGLANDIEGTVSIGKNDFDNFTDLQKSIDSMDSRFEELRQEQSRLQDVSDARNRGKK